MCVLKMKIWVTYIVERGRWEDSASGVNGDRFQSRPAVPEARDDLHEATLLMAIDSEASSRRNWRRKRRTSGDRASSFGP
jgi:hypothetical protein